jgi:hypothetical protein
MKMRHWFKITKTAILFSAKKRKIKSSLSGADPGFQVKGGRT